MLDNGRAEECDKNARHHVKYEAAGDIACCGIAIMLLDLVEKTKSERVLEFRNKPETGGAEGA